MNCPRTFPLCVTFVALLAATAASGQTTNALPFRPSTVNSIVAEHQMAPLLEKAKETDQVAFIRYAIVYLGLDDLHSIRDEINQLLES